MEKSQNKTLRQRNEIESQKRNPFRLGTKMAFNKKFWKNPINLLFASAVVIPFAHYLIHLYAPFLNSQDLSTYEEKKALMNAKRVEQQNLDKINEKN